MERGSMMGGAVDVVVVDSVRLDVPIPPAAESA